MQLYFFSNETGEYISTRLAAKDPEQGNYLIPANAVIIKPDDIKENETAVINNDKTEWLIVPDFRSTTFYNTETKELKFFKLGEEKPNSFVEEKPNSSDETWNQDFKKWELLFDAKQARKYLEIKLAFDKHLKDGCLLSSGFKIDSKLSDSTLLSTAYERMKLSNSETIGLSDYINDIHQLSLSEFEAVLIDLGNFTQLAFEKKWSLRKQISNSVDDSELNLIMW